MLKILFSLPRSGGKESMVKYIISGRLPALWEDFVPLEDKALPRVTITAKPMSGDDCDGWKTITITGHEQVTREIAVTLLEEIIGQPIELIEAGLVQAV